MKTQINNFWNRFIAIQIDLVNAASSANTNLLEKLIMDLLSYAAKIDPALKILFSFSSDGNSFSKLIFLTKGDYKLEAIIRVVLSKAPQLNPWKYQIGIKPYKHSVTTLCAESNFLNDHTTIYQIYFGIQKIYKSSNKLHLIIYFEMDKQHKKYDLHEAMENIFTWFLGDVVYHNHISRYKIVRRKYSAIRFAPLDELKNMIQYKTLT